MLSNKLYTFLEVAESASASVAAKKLNLTQPAVSQQLRALEQELGTKLYVRSEKGIILTNTGEIAFKYANRIANLYKSMQEELKNEKSQSHKLVIGVTQTIEFSIVSEILAEFCTQNKGTHIKIISDTIKNLYTKLKLYEVDLIIVNGNASLDNRFNRILLSTDYLVYVVGKDDPLANKSMISMSKLREQSLILRTKGSSTRELFEACLESLNDNIMNYNVIMEVDNIATIKSLVANGFGSSVLSHSVCTQEIKKGKLVVVPIENLSIVREINIVYHKDFEYTDQIDQIRSIYTSRMSSGL
ncbi:MAG TPA: LysR family transcriptional regulator [Candidatus Borkfalkia faecipullorum]|uniref:LysR family transcriptional regulator n=1 Tax=Candidatus Borkfalkia faecipullorum TaxID=2838510 RepID=A0A9D2AF57_9FIRM|nr:LysR family transcriptional regulator [Candidatus Borkfalkia faecipullorum]